MCSAVDMVNCSEGDCVMRYGGIWYNCGIG